MLGIFGVECVVRVLGFEQLLAVCLDGRLVSSLKSKLSTELFMWMCVCLHLNYIVMKSVLCAFILNLQVKTIFSTVTWHRWASSCDWLAGVIAVTSSFRVWTLVLIVYLMVSAYVYV